MLGLDKHSVKRTGQLCPRRTMLYMHVYVRDCLVQYCEGLIVFLTGRVVCGLALVRARAVLV
jgi:hypothetical protein